MSYRNQPYSALFAEIRHLIIFIYWRKETIDDTKCQSLSLFAVRTGHLYLKYFPLSILLPDVLFINSLPVNGVTKIIQFNETISSSNFQSFRKKWDHKFWSAFHKTVKSTTCVAYHAQLLAILDWIAVPESHWGTICVPSGQVSQSRWKVTAMSTFCFWRNTEECGSRALLSSQGTHHGHQPQLTQTQPSLLCLSLLILLVMIWSYLCSWYRESTRKNSSF